MSRPRRVSLKTYRAHRLEVVENGGTGWIVTIYPQLGTDDAAAGPTTVLRNAVPNGLQVLIEEAQRHVDRVLDGPEWLR